MKTAAEYRAMAEECFKWAREAQVEEVRISFLQLGRFGLMLLLNSTAGLRPRCSQRQTPRSSSNSPRDKAPRIAANIAKLPELLRRT